MATDENIIVAIELGSSKITGIAGRKQPDGGIQVLAVAQEPSSTFIRKGRVFNIEKTKQCLNNIREKLSKDLNKPISQAYVGIGGQGLMTALHTVQRQLGTQTGITAEIVDSLLDNNLNTPMGNREILEVIPQEYKVGTQTQVDPIGVLTDSIEGRFLNVTAVPTLRENIDKCFEQVGLKIANHTISTLALGDSILSESERRSGCALVDMGADTTTVAIYKNNILRQLSVIPLGGSNVTKDIMTLQLERDEAEQLKLKYGTAYAEFADDEEPSTITLSDGRTVDELTFLELTEARIEEIIVNVASQIKRSGYAKDKLLAGIVITGGVAATKNLERAFREHTDFEQFRFAKNLPITVRLPQGQESIKLGNVNTVIALVDKGTENCCGTPATATTPVDLFSGHEGTSKDRAAETHDRHGQKTDTTTKLHGKESDESEEELTDEKPRKKKQKKTHDGPTFKERCSKFWQSISRIVTDDSDPNLLDKDKNQ